MTAQFSTTIEEMTLLDESAFRQLGGKTLHFDELLGNSCRITATGTKEAVRSIAFGIREHHTAAITAPVAA